MMDGIRGIANSVLSCPAPVVLVIVSLVFAGVMMFMHVQDPEEDRYVVLEATSYTFLGVAVVNLVLYGKGLTFADAAYGIVNWIQTSPNAPVLFLVLLIGLLISMSVVIGITVKQRGRL